MLASCRRPVDRASKISVIVIILQACDVLYEAGAVGPIAELAPRLLFTSGGRLLLADPAERTVQNRWAPQNPKTQMSGLCPCAVLAHSPPDQHLSSLVFPC